MEKNEVILSLSLSYSLSDQNKMVEKIARTDQSVYKKMCNHEILVLLSSGKKTQIKCLMQKLKHFKVSKS